MVPLGQQKGSVAIGGKRIDLFPSPDLDIFRLRIRSRDGQEGKLETCGLFRQDGETRQAVLQKILSVPATWRDREAIEEVPEKQDGSKPNVGRG